MTIYTTGVRIKIDLGYKIGSPQDRKYGNSTKGYICFGHDDTSKVAYFSLGIC